MFSSKTQCTFVFACCWSLGLPFELSTSTNNNNNNHNKEDDTN